MVSSTIRSYRYSDREAVEALWASVFGYGAPHNAPSLSLERKLAFQSDLLFVAEQNGVIVGTVMAGYDGHRGWIYSLAVLPEHRGQGLGTALLSHAEEELARLGCLKINLQILEDNREVIDFYARKGYRVEPRISMGKIIYKS